MWGFLSPPGREAQRPRKAGLEPPGFAQRSVPVAPMGGGFTTALSLSLSGRVSSPSASGRSRPPSALPAGAEAAGRGAKRLPEPGQERGEWELQHFSDWGFAGGEASGGEGATPRTGRCKEGAAGAAKAGTSESSPTVRIHGVRSAVDLRPASSVGAGRQHLTSPIVGASDDLQRVQSVGSRASCGTAGPWYRRTSSSCRPSSSSGAQSGNTNVYRKPKSIVIDSIPDRLVQVKVSPSAPGGAEQLRNLQLAQLFGFLCKPAGGLLADAQRFIRGPLLEVPRLEEEMLRGEPSMDTMQLQALSAHRSTSLRCVLQAYSRAPGALALLPGGGPPEGALAKPAFCRFLLDSRLLARGDSEACPYHWATRLFDSLARAPPGGNAAAPSSVHSATVDHTVLLVRHLLAVALTAEDREDFFLHRLPEAQQIVEAMLKTADECTQAAREMQPPESDASPRHALRFNRDPPPHFHGSVKEWSKGMIFWEQTVAEQGDNIVQRVEQQFALACHISDLVIDPGTLYVCSEYSDLFRNIFEFYSDGERTYPTESGAVPQKHMSFANFFRFCVDFSVFPQLCSFDEVRVAYASADCLCDPRELDLAGASLSRQSSKAAGGRGSVAGPQAGLRSVRHAGKRMTAVNLRTQLQEDFGLGGSGSPKAAAAAASPKGPLRPSFRSPPPSRKSTKSVVVRDGALLGRAVNISWIEKDFSEMSEPEQGAYKLLSTLHDASADHFLNVRALFFKPGAGDRESPGSVGAEEILGVLRRWHVEHRFEQRDLLAFVNLLSPGLCGTLKVLDLEKAVCLVRADRERRRPLFLDPRASRNRLSNLAALGTEARRLDDEDGPGSPGPARGSRAPAPAFGHAAFMEALLRIGFRHLHGSGVEVQAALPPSHKGLWLLAFLHFQFDRLLRQRQAAPREAAAEAAAARAARVCRNPRGRKTLPPILLQQLSLSPGPRDGARGGARDGARDGRAGLARSSSVREAALLEEPSEDVQYSSCLARLLDAHPDLFQRCGGGARGGEDGGNSPPEDEPLEAQPPEAQQPEAESPCGVCGRRRDHRGVGSPLCHGCSGVDARPLCSSPLRWAIERRQLLHEFGELCTPDNPGSPCSLLRSAAAAAPASP